MRVKKVWRYCCDFCKKTSLSKGAMNKHEKHCTMNPDRKCRMCAYMEGYSAPLPELIAMLPEPSELLYEIECGYQATGEGKMPAFWEAFEKMRDAAEQCPACILAALRQRGIPAWVWEEKYDYAKECKSLWDEVNAENMERYNY